MSANWNHNGRTQAICVDPDADGTPGTYQNLDGNLQRDPAFKKVDFKKVRHCLSEKSLIL